MRKTVEQRGRHLGIGKHAGPFGEAQVGRDDDAGSLIKLAKQMEQQRTAGLAERQVTKFIEHYEIGVHESCCKLPRLATKLLLFECVDQFDGGEETHTAAIMFERLHTDRGCQMSLSRTGRTRYTLPIVIAMM